MSYSDVVLSCNTTSDYLLLQMLPQATELALLTGEALGDVLLRIPPTARRLFFHLNLSDTRQVLPHRSRLVEALHQRGIHVVNGALVRTGKRFIQKRLAAAGARSSITPHAHDQWVIVKSNTNHGGLAEIAANNRAPQMMMTGPASYQILPSWKVPPHWFERSDVVIESFVSNAQGMFLRIYIAGDRVVVSRAWSGLGIKRMEEGITRRNSFVSLHADAGAWGSADLRAQVQIAVHAFSIDFATLDVVCDEERRHTIIDINPTPWWGAESQQGVIEHLAAAFADRELRSLAH